MRHRVLPIVLLAGCSVSESRFVDKFVEADCAYLLECSSEPVLTFLGWDSLEACMADRGPEVAADAARCELDSPAARACIKAVEEQTCAADEQEREYPQACFDAWVECTGDPDPDTSADTDTDTEGTGT